MASFADQNAAPPDPNIAVGPNDVIEATNSVLSFFRRDGTLESSLDIGAFIGAPCGASAVTDPRVVYDPLSGRFYFTVLSFDLTATNNCVVVLASPATGVATGTWNGYVLSSTATLATGGVPEADQPGLGFSDNLVAVTWNYFDSTDASFAGSQLDIIQKSDLISNSLSNNTLAALISGPASPQPVVSIGATGGHQYVVFNDSDKGCGDDGNPQSIGVYDFTGQPEQGTLAFTVAHPLVATATAGCSGTTPAPQQGTTIALSTDDDRLLNAVWQNNVIWTGGGTDCTPSGDTGLRSCLNIDSISTATGVAATATQLIVGVVGAYLYYPAISVDRSDNAFVVFDQSSASSPEAIMVAGIQGGALSPFATLHTSSTWYDPANAFCAPDCRWGDYSGAAQDPSHPNDVWVVSEHTDGDITPNCGNNSSHYCWNTFIGRYTYPRAPSISGLAAPTGPISGGRTVTVNGSDFLPNTTATFGGAPITIIAGTLTPDSFQVTTPPGSVGNPKAIQATDTAGTSPLTPADVYVYGDSFSVSGKSDLAAVNSTSAYVMTSNGSSFAAPTGWASGAFFGGVATLAGDLNHDGMTDLVAVNSNNVWVRMSTGHSFSTPVAWSSGTPFFGSKATLLADVNGDGMADLIAVNAASVWVMLSTGSSFSAPVAWSNGPFYGGISTMAGDVTGSGRAALVAVSSTSTWVMTSSGTGFNPPTAWSTVLFFGSRATMLGDVSGDGKADLVAVNNTSTYVMTSNGGAFNNSPAQWSSGAFYGSRATLLGDLQGNGHEDLIAVNDASTWVMSSTPTRFAGPVQWSATLFYGNVFTVSGG